MAEQAKRFSYLDGLRGLLALTVMLSHIWGGVTDWSFIRPFSGAYLSVDFFFILSGFVLTHLLIHTAAKGEAYSAPRFMALRFLRLWPMHVLVVGLALVIFAYNRAKGQYAPDGVWNDPMTFWGNIPFLMNLGIAEIKLINDPSWSIGIEFWVSSLMLPLLARQRAVVGLSIAALIYGFFFVEIETIASVSTVNGFISLGLLKGIAGMALGSAMYRLEPRWSGVLSARLEPQMLLGLMVFCFGAILFGIYSQTGNRLDFLYIILFLPLLASSAVARCGAFEGFLSAEPIVLLGTLSFSIYLIHTPIIILIDAPMTRDAYGALPAVFYLALICVAAAAVLHLVLEKPALRFSRRIRFARRGSPNRR